VSELSLEQNRQKELEKGAQVSSRNCCSIIYTYKYGERERERKQEKILLTSQRCACSPGNMKEEQNRIRRISSVPFYRSLSLVGFAVYVFVQEDLEC
jgi:hypothetical protein